jgi:hypothetical protein
METQIKKEEERVRKGRSQKGKGFRGRVLEAWATKG